jgi:hypothetical protein
VTSTMQSHPGKAATTSGGGALWFGLLGAGLGWLVEHPTIGGVAGATLGASVGASMSHLFEDANFFGETSQSESAAIHSDITKVSILSAIGAAAAGTIGAKVIKKHPTVAGVLAAGAGSAIVAAVADNAFGTPTGQIGTGDWRPIGVFS